MFCFRRGIFTFEFKFCNWKFYKKYFRKKKIVLEANYEINRSYMYSDDLVRWLFKILFHSTTKCPVYNVGSDDKVSIRKIAKILAKRYNLNLNLPKLTSLHNDTYIPNINKAKNSPNEKSKYHLTQKCSNEEILDLLYSLPIIFAS